MYNYQRQKCKNKFLFIWRVSTHSAREYPLVQASILPRVHTVHLSIVIVHLVEPTAARATPAPLFDSLTSVLLPRRALVPGLLVPSTAYLSRPGSTPFRIFPPSPEVFGVPLVAAASREP